MLSVWAAVALSGHYIDTTQSGLNRASGNGNPYTILLTKYEKNYSEADVSQKRIDGVSFFLYSSNCNPDDVDPECATVLNDYCSAQNVDKVGQSACVVGQIGTEYQTGGASSVHAEHDVGEIHVSGLTEGWYFFREANPLPDYSFDQDAEGNDIIDYWFYIPPFDNVDCGSYDQNTKYTQDPQFPWVWINPEGKNCSVATINAYNRVGSGELDVSKTLSNRDGSALTDEQAQTQWTFEVDFGQDADPESGYEDGGSFEFWRECGPLVKTGCDDDQPEILDVLISRDQITLRTGEKLHFVNLPVGLEYNILESYTPAVSQSSTYSKGRISQNENNNITVSEFVNIQEDLKTVRISKRVESYCPPVTAAQSTVPDEILNQVQDDMGGVVPYADACEPTEGWENELFDFEVHFLDNFEQEQYPSYYILPDLNLDADNEPETPLLQLPDFDDDTSEPVTRQNIIHLKHGQTAVFVNIFPDWNYSFQEVNFNPTKYIPDVALFSGQVLKDFESEFVNRAPAPDYFGDLEITKTVLSNRAVDTSKEFDFDFCIGDTDSDEYYLADRPDEYKDADIMPEIGGEYLFLGNVDSSGNRIATCQNITLKDGESFKVNQIPAATNYWVQEADYTTEGYNAQIKERSGFIVQDTVNTAHIVNEIYYATIEVTKEIVKLYPDAIPLPEGVIDPDYWNKYEWNMSLNVTDALPEELVVSASAKQTFDVVVGKTWNISEEDYSASGWSTSYQNASGLFNVADDLVQVRVINTYVNAPKIDIPVSKFWDKSLLPSADNPNSVTITIYDDFSWHPGTCTIACSDRKIKELVLNSATDWKGVFANLPKYSVDDGHEIEYYALETRIGNSNDFAALPWDVSVVGRYDAPGGISIRNQYVLQKCKWDDTGAEMENDEDCLKPDDICSYDPSLPASHSDCQPPCPTDQTKLSNDPSCSSSTPENPDNPDNPDSPPAPAPTPPDSGPTVGPLEVTGVPGLELLALLLVLLLFGVASAIARTSQI
ncbi:hypothetical protein FACS1894125_0180 [Actinomycetota bacterium]|nr:hypothetical protein FACS1894125_0180 [Actinomycetota bacterium]